MNSVNRRTRAMRACVLAALLSLATTACKSSQQQEECRAGRWQMLVSGGSTLFLLDTATGESWAMDGTGRWQTVAPAPARAAE
jgi:hypothetical protein